MAELCLDKKRDGQLENLVGAAQFFDLALKGFDPVTLFLGDAIAHAIFDFVYANAVMQGLRHAAIHEAIDSMVAHIDG